MLEEEKNFVSREEGMVLEGNKMTAKWDKVAQKHAFVMVSNKIVGNCGEKWVKNGVFHEKNR